ncbi:hypothetical protein IP78_06750 [Brevundimonas sp. AAP58]|uniref:hypothetical protein n=1 Tax=Brevundimonas sp. AAP58 TaxID=1523422 RepID=UPI0006B939B3|nr:hypothetical protein [Brevundimonas sp. AAP58]KPF80758.1 hypothetical protein IP78_06750 [Brevundimonas sp. AAP58]
MYRFRSGAAALALAVATLGAAGCSSTFEATTLDATTGRFPISQVLPPEAIKVDEAFPVNDNRRLLLVRTNLGTLTQYEEYFEESMENIGFFQQVVRPDEFERMLVQAGKADGVSGTTGFAGLAQASRAWGPFLVADFNLTAGAGYQVDMVMTVYDPSTARELYKIDHGVTNWAGLDGVLFEPSFNAFIEWLERNSPTYPEDRAVPAASDDDED